MASISFKLQNIADSTRRILISAVSNSEPAASISLAGTVRNPTHTTNGQQTQMCLAAYNPTLSDHLYVSLPIGGPPVTFIVNGTNVTYEGTDDGAGEWPSYIAFVDSLRALGIALIKTNDSYGCYPLYRLQNMTGQSLNFAITCPEFFGQGLRVLPIVVNDTVQLSIPASQTGYLNLAAKLSADVRHLPSTIAHASLNRSWLLPAKHGSTPYQYHFWIDDVALVNPVNQSTNFYLNTDGDAPAGERLDDLLAALNQLNLPYSHWVDINEIVSISFYIPLLDVVTKVKIGQSRPIELEPAGTDLISINVVENLWEGTTYEVISDENGNQALEFLLYDPINLDGEE